MLPKYGIINILNVVYDKTETVSRIHFQKRDLLIFA